MLLGKRKTAFRLAAACIGVLVLLVPLRAAASPLRLCQPSLTEIMYSIEFAMRDAERAEQERLAELQRQAEEARQAALAAQTASTAPTTSGIQVVTHTVRRGETLIGIASRYRVTVNELVAWNGLRNANHITVGQRLVVANPGVATSSSSGHKVHVVAQGESLWKIAQDYRTTVATLARLNGISQTAVIQPGQRLTVPDTTLMVSRSAAPLSFAWPVQGTISSLYGPRWGSFHQGLDIAAPTGRHILAARSGVVEFAGWRPGYGYNIVLNHGGGVKTVYAHASRLHVRTGQQVAQGQHIANVGSTGNSTGPHLHFEIHINGRHVDPLTYLSKSAGR